MPRYAVRQYDGATKAHDEHEWVNAESPKAAAELACGEPLSARGAPNDMRATVMVNEKGNVWTYKPFYRAAH